MRHGFESCRAYGGAVPSVECIDFKDSKHVVVLTYLFEQQCVC